jgi:hypothetical protein
MTWTSREWREAFEAMSFTVTIEPAHTAGGRGFDESRIVME